MGLTEADLRRRQAELWDRERDLAAREGELHARRSWRRLWWALRLAPWGLAEMIVASWTIVAAVLLGDQAVRLSCGFGGAVIAVLTLARMCGATGPRIKRGNGDRP
jgi:hypothetical protein